AVDDPFSGRENIYTALADNPAPEKLLAELGANYAVFGTTIKKWSVGAPLQAVLDSMSTLLADGAVREGNIKHIRVDMPTEALRIVDNSTIPDLCLQHLVALMIVDRGASFASVHDAARMSDPRVLAVRKLVELIGSEELQNATPARQAIVQIETADGRSLSHRTRVVRGPGANRRGAREMGARARYWWPRVGGPAGARAGGAGSAARARAEPVSRLRPLLQA